MSIRCKLRVFLNVPVDDEDDLRGRARLDLVDERAVAADAAADGAPAHGDDVAQIRLAGTEDEVGEVVEAATTQRQPIIILSGVVGQAVSL